MDKDQWEPVPNIVSSSMRAVHTTFQSLKSWAAYQEQDMKMEQERRDALERKLKDTDKQVEQLQERLKFLFAYTNSAFARQHKQTSALSGCLRRELGMTKTFISGFCQQFDVSVDKSNSQIAPEASEATAALSVEEDLAALCTELEGQLAGLNESFSRWKGWRQDEETRSDIAIAERQELRLAEERTRERLITWRETLKESAHVVDALSGAIVTTQRDVAELKSTVVPRSTVDEVVKKKGEELEKVMWKNNERIGELFSTLSDHKAEVQNNVALVEQSMKERIENHGEEVIGHLRNNLNPITTYLNTMHVKADAARQELDELITQVPQLRNQIGDVSASLQRSESDSKNQINDVRERLDQVAADLLSHSDLLHKNRQEWSDSMTESSRDIQERVMDVKNQHKRLQVALDSVQQHRLTSLDHGLSTLEQKVAKWVHSQPLPAKISEARLYALESHLLEETNARMRLEAQIQDLPILLKSTDGPDGTGVTQSWASLHGGTGATMSTASLMSVHQSQSQDRSAVSLPKLSPVQSPPAAGPPQKTNSTPRGSRSSTRKMAPENYKAPDLAVMHGKQSETGLPIAM